MNGRRPTQTMSLSTLIVWLPRGVGVGDFDAAGRGLGARDLRAELDVEPLLLEMARGFLGQALVGHREEGVERFEHHDFGAETAPHAAELEADDAGADHRELLRHALEIERAPVVDDVLAVERHALEFRRDRTAGEHDVFRAQRFLLAVVRGEFHLAAGQQLAVALQRGDAGALEQHGDARGAGLDDAGLALLHLRDVERRRRSTLMPWTPSSSFVL